MAVGAWYRGDAMATTCNVTRGEFRVGAKALAVAITPFGKGAEQWIAQLPVTVKEFSTGSMGWYGNGKFQMEVGGKLVTVQAGITFTVIGSKELPQDRAAA